MVLSAHSYQEPDLHAGVCLCGHANCCSGENTHFIPTKFSINTQSKTILFTCSKKIQAQYKTSFSFLIINPVENPDILIYYNEQITSKLLIVCSIIYGGEYCHLKSTPFPNTDLIYIQIHNIHTYYWHNPNQDWPVKMLSNQKHSSDSFKKLSKNSWERYSSVLPFCDY